MVSPAVAESNDEQIAAAISERRQAALLRAATDAIEDLTDDPEFDRHDRDPGQDEIERRAEDVRRRWSLNKSRKRRFANATIATIVDDETWHPPVANTGSLPPELRDGLKLPRSI